MTYVFKTEQFEGPLDLLLDLIERQKMDITRVSLAAITDQYVAYVKTHEDISLQNMAAFLSVAAKLILVKSYALLPLLQLDDDEEQDVRELEKQLAALKAFKDHHAHFAAFIASSSASYGNDGMWGQAPLFCPPPNVNGAVVHAAFLRTLHTIPRLEDMEQRIVSDIISLETRIAAIQESVRARATVAFSDLTATATSRADVVVSFLALLELVKQKIIVARQDGRFAEILLHSNN